MPVTGTKRVVPKEVFGGRTGIQFCIDGSLVSETLKMIPEGVSIVGANAVLGTVLGRRKVPIPNALRKLGISQLRESTPCKEAKVIVDTIDKGVLLRKIQKACKAIGAEPDKAYFEYIVLSDKEATGKFVRTTKEIKPYEEDLRKKLVVLGLRDAQGRIQGLLSKLGAKKYVCDIQEVTYRTAICRPE